MGENGSLSHGQVSDEHRISLPIKESDHANENLEFKGASFGGSVSNLATTTVGAGIMALPAAMKVLGLGPGLAMIIFLAFLTEASIDMLVRFSRPGRCTSYGAVMGEAFGKVGKILLQIVVIIKTIGVLIVYMIIIGDALSGTSWSSKGPHHVGVFEGWFGAHWWNGRAFVLFVTTVVVFAPLASLKRIDSLKYTSAISVALAVVFLVITAYVAVVKLIDHSLSKPRWLPHVTNLASVWKLFTSVPVLVTAFICHYNVHSIQNELQKHSQMQNVARTSVTLCTSIYLLTSTFGFLLFGESTLGDVLANFDKNLGFSYSSVLNDIIRVSYVVHLMLVFPVIFFALRLNIDGLIFPSKRPLLSDIRRFALITVVLIVVIFVGANFIPSIWDAFQFTGATAAVCIGFIFPAAIVLRDRHGIATKKDKILGVIMIVLAVFCSLVAIYSNLSSLFKRN